MSNHQKGIIVEFMLKNVTECICILVNYLNYKKQKKIVQSPNRHYSWICVEKLECIYILINSKNYQNGLV